MFRTLATMLLGVTAIATAAEGHPRLLAAMPAEQSTEVKVSRIELHFSEKLISAFSGLDLVMTSMPGMKMAQPMKIALQSRVSSDGAALIGIPAKPLAPGSYEVRYHVVSTDTHRVQAVYGFTVR